MAIRKLTLLPDLLRRGRSAHCYHSLYSSSYSISIVSADGGEPCHLHNSSLHPSIPYYFLCNRFFSTNGASGPGDINFDRIDSVMTHSVFANSQLSLNGSVGGGGYDDSILPVRALISLLDSYHHLTGFPWWIVIASSTLAMRLTLFPFVVLQLYKLKSIGELFPKLPPPLPPPMSGRSFGEQMSLFLKQKRAAGCPSFLWFFASLTVQVPCFFLWITSIRRMSLDHHPGFESGGALWFQHLTEYPNGVLGPIFPLLIAGLHFTNVQIASQRSSLGKMTGLLGTLAKYYKYYLEFLTLPILFVTFNVPQGSLVYWLVNSSLSLVQQCTLNHPSIRKKLGLIDNQVTEAATNCDEIDTYGASDSHQSRKQANTISVADFSPTELVNLSIVHLSQHNKDKALPPLRLALDKEPENVRALIIMGQILLQDDLPAEAAHYLERAMSKHNPSGHPMEAEEVDLFILSSQWAGIAYIRQNKYEEGIAHLERLTRMKEPKHMKSKAHYYDGLLILSSALYNVGRKAEAAKYLRMAASYDSKYTYLLDQCEKDEDDDLINDLVNSRRADY